MDKMHVVFEIVLLLQGTPLDEFARKNLTADGSRAIVRCAVETSIGTPEGELCKRNMATAMRRYSYRFTAVQLGVLADLYVSALNHLEPQALPRVRDSMCDPTSPEYERDADAARAVCHRLSTDY